MSGWTTKRCFTCLNLRVMPRLAMDCGLCEERKEKRRVGFPKRKKQGAAA